MSEHADRDSDNGSEGGEVSETTELGGSPEQVAPEDAVAGDPSSESGETQEGSAGPNTVS